MKVAEARIPPDHACASFFIVHRSSFIALRFEFPPEKKMASIPDSDSFIDSLYDDLRAALSAANDLHHPVYPASPKRLAELEARIAELRASIAARKASLRPAA